MSDAPAAPPTTASTPAHAARQARRRGLGLIALVALLAAAAWGLWHGLAGRHQQHTDNAYVAGHVVQVTPQVAGTVVAVHAEDTDTVRAGQALVQLDAADARLALARAEAELARTVREVRGRFASGGALQAQVAQRSAELARAQAEQARAQDDVDRRRPLVEGGAVAGEEFQHAQAQLAAARAGVAAAQAALGTAREQLAAHLEPLRGLQVPQHPAVLQAAAQVREAWLGTQRTTLLAPVAGQVARRSVQLGQRVQPGAALMTVVPLDALWVDANFKESQLAELRVGQSATLYADVHGKRQAYQGRVAGLGAGTGAAFALLPAQNATGNWIKIVQRVPVRIALDAAELAAHPLRIGLSMDVTVDTRSPGSAPVAGAAPPPVARTQVFEAQEAQADAAVARILQAHLGPAAQATRR